MKKLSILLQNPSNTECITSIALFRAFHKTEPKTRMLQEPKNQRTTKFLQPKQPNKQEKSHKSRATEKSNKIERLKM